MLSSRNSDSRLIVRVLRNHRLVILRVPRGSGNDGAQLGRGQRFSGSELGGISNHASIVEGGSADERGGP